MKLLVSHADLLENWLLITLSGITVFGTFHEIQIYSRFLYGSIYRSEGTKPMEKT